MIMTCRELTELLIDFVADELPPEHRAHLEQHLLQCPPCTAYLDTYKTTIQLTRQLPCVPLPPELAARLRQALQEIREELAEPPERAGCRTGDSIYERKRKRRLFAVLRPWRLRFHGW